MNGLKPHEYVKDGKVLILRRIDKDRNSHQGDFHWPIDWKTMAPEKWEASKTCGDGIHGWPWGFGLGDGVDYDIVTDIWQVVSANPEDVVGEIDGRYKCKARLVERVFEGSFREAYEKVTSEWNAIISTAASGDAAQLAASGDAAQLAASGYAAQLAASGYAAQLAASGNDAKLAASGIDAQLAASGNDAVIVCAGTHLSISAGPHGVIAATWWDKEGHPHIVTATVGKKGFKANIAYKLNDKHKFEETR